MVKSTQGEMPAAVLAAEIRKDQPCTRRSAMNALRNAKFLLNQAAISLFFAEVALRAKKKVAHENPAREVLATGIRAQECTLQHATNAAKIAKFHLDLPATNQSIAELVSARIQ